MVYHTSRQSRRTRCPRLVSLVSSHRSALLSRIFSHDEFAWLYINSIRGSEKQKVLDTDARAHGSLLILSDSLSITMGPADVGDIPG